MLRRLLPLALLTAALLVPASATAQERTISVSGSVTQKVPNDAAHLGFSVSMERRTRGAALGVVAQRLRAVIAAVQTVPGVGSGDVTTGSISVRKVIRAKHVLYRAGEGIGVVLHQPEKAGELVSAAIGAGATGTSGPDFFVGDSELAYNMALVAAFDQAKAKAVALAAQAGASLGAAITIEEGGGVSAFPPAAAKGSPVACGAAPPVARGRATCPGATPPVKPGSSTVTATVHVVFELR